MPVIALPNHLAALNLRLRSFSEITALVTTAAGYTAGASVSEQTRPRISPVRQAFWALPTHAILLRRAGGPEPDRSVRIRSSRTDIWFYGPGPDAGSQERTAYDLWAIVAAALCPEHGETDSFVQASCRVYGVEDESDPIPFVDQDTGYRVIVWPVVMRWSEVAVP